MCEYTPDWYMIFIGYLGKVQQVTDLFTTDPGEQFHLRFNLETNGCILLLYCEYHFLKETNCTNCITTTTNKQQHPPPPPPPPGNIFLS